MNRRIVAALALAQLGSGLAAQQGTPLLAAPAARGVVLRWAWPEGERPTGYLLDRRLTGGAWQRITVQPLTRVRDRRAARQILGDAYDRLEGMLFPADPLSELRDPETSRSLLLFAAEMEPTLATALALRYDDRDARAGLGYEYRLIALTAAGERLMAVAGPVVAGAYRPAPAPDSLRVIQSGNQIALLWTTRSSSSAYNVYRVSGGTASRINQAPVVAFTRDAGAASAAAPALFTDAAGAPGDTIRYAVEGIDPFGRLSQRSAPVPVVVRDLTPPAPPRGTSAAARGDTVVVTWAPPPDQDVASYQLWRAAAQDGPYAKVGAPVSGSAREAREPGVPARKLVWYRVTATDRVGNESRPSPGALIEVPDLTPPPVPDSLTGRADTGRVRISWKPDTAADLRGYRVYRAVIPAGEFVLLTAKPISRAAYIDTVPRRASHPFYYRVTAVDSSFNESGPTPVVALAPPDVTPPSAPLLTRITPGEDQLIARWLPNPEPDVAGYRIRTRLHGAEAWVDRPETIPVTRLVDTISAVPPRRLIDVSLIAVDRSGNRSLPSRPVVGEAYHRRPPAAVGVKRAGYSARDGGVVVEWVRDTAPGRVLILRRQGNDTTARIIGETPRATGRFVDRLARRGRHYEYLLRVLDQFGNAAESPRAEPVDVPARGHS